MSNLSLVHSQDLAQRAQRKSLLRAISITHAGIERRAIMRNLSDTGALIETDLHLDSGDVIVTEIAGHGRREAVVRWVCGGRIGIEFCAAVALGNGVDPKLAALNREKLL